MSLAIFVSGHKVAASTKIIHTRAVVDISLKFLSSPSYSVWKASGKREVFVFNDFKSKGWEKIGNVHLKSCIQTLEETRRIQDPV